MKKLVIVAALMLAGHAFAQTSAGSSSGSTAIVQPGQINSPIVEVNSAAPDRMRNDIHTNQAATAATVFVNPPAADTCAMPGNGFGVQAPGGGVVVSAGGKVAIKCDMRADAISLKVTGQSPAVVKARYCMDEDMRESFAAAGEPCIDARPQRTSTATSEGVGFAQQPKPWQAGG